MSAQEVLDLLEMVRIHFEQPIFQNTGLSRDKVDATHAITTKRIVRNCGLRQFMQLTEKEYEAYHRATSDFRSDHDKASSFVRKKFNIPDNRYFSVRSDGVVMVDMNRKRVVESRKLSKSDQ